jgi:hypothetical protein
MAEEVYVRSPKNDRPPQPSRRGFDDDQFYGNAPSPSSQRFGAALSAPEARATVKWVQLPPAAALTTALVRRTREVLFGLLGLIAWRRSEDAVPAYVVTGARVHE